MERVSIFSFNRRFVIANVSILLTLIAIHCYFAIQYETTQNRGSFGESLINTVGYVSNSIPVAIIITLVIEGIITMFGMLWNYYKRKQEHKIEEIVAKTVSKTKTETEDRVNQAWEEWLEGEKLEGKLEGIHFKKKPPYNDDSGKIK